MPAVVPRDAKSQLTPAQELLLRAALLEGDAALSAWREWRAANPLEAIDDASFQLLPRLYLNLQRLGVRRDRSMPKLRGVYRHAWLRNRVTMRAAAAAAASLNAAAVPVLLLGGIALGLGVDADPGVGLVAVDLHVDEAQLGVAVTALEAAGWMIGNPALIIRLAPFTPAIVGRHPGWTGTTLRLHLQPFAVGCPRAAARELRQRAASRELEGSAVLLPDATDLLILACLGRWAPDPGRACSWIADVVALAGARAGIDWDAWWERSRRAGLAHPVCRALLDVHRRFELAVPAAVIERAAAAGAALLAGRDDIGGLVHDARPRPPLKDLVAAHWRRYSGGSRSTGRRRTPFSLVRYGWLQTARLWQMRRRPAAAAEGRAGARGSVLEPGRW